MMRDVARIEKVMAVGPSTLSVTWEDGITSLVDLAGWIARGGRRFAAVGNALVFATAKRGLYNASVTWDDEEGDLSIDAEHLRMIADHQAPFDADAAAAWQAETGVSNVEAADLLGVSPSTWSSYKAGTTIPDTVVRLCRAMLADPAALAAHLRPRKAGNPGGGPVYKRAIPREDFARGAELNAAGTTTPHFTLSSAVIAFYALPDEQQARATIKVLDGGLIYRASEIRRLHDKPPPDEEDLIRAALASR